VPIFWHTDEGPEVDYRVWEETPPSPKPKKAEPESEPKSIIFFKLSPELPWDADLRPETPQLDPASVRVRHITAVSFTTEDHEVQRHRTEKVKPLKTRRRWHGCNFQVNHAPR